MAYFNDGTGCVLNSGDERFGGCKLNPGCSVRSNATVGSRPMTCGERGEIVRGGCEERCVYMVGVVWSQ